ncbi:hypothetical protein FGK63_18885 [Ruegeria sediminis]|uniref:Secreted protein n=1 Tax=Ruegeria sediminis TaxID=2583820 RepID=A0ABY2WSQ5_9RHOB|nr:hypothetical protein [Ruegeria sediminis]TMV03736.1 hypothetical protein FGK63_18885 [Ruegeria sediminis]
MKKPTLIIAAACFAAPLAAAEWETRPGDVPLDKAELDALAGQTLTFYDDGQSRYSAGGGYSYTYSAANGGGTAFGTYHIAEDGSVCTEFRNGFTRCDLFVRSGGRLILINEKGERYPVRPQ